MNFYVSDLMDVGIEIMPTKELAAQMSSGVPYYERDLLNIIRQGRGVPAVRLVLMGIALRPASASGTFLMPRMRGHRLGGGLRVRRWSGDGG